MCQFYWIPRYLVAYCRGIYMVLSLQWLKEKTYRKINLVIVENTCTIESNRVIYAIIVFVTVANVSYSIFIKVLLQRILCINTVVTCISNFVFVRVLLGRVWFERTIIWLVFYSVIICIRVTSISFAIIVNILLPRINLFGTVVQNRITTEKGLKVWWESTNS